MSEMQFKTDPTADGIVSSLSMNTESGFLISMHQGRAGIYIKDVNCRLQTVENAKRAIDEVISQLGEIRNTLVAYGPKYERGQGANNISNAVDKAYEAAGWPTGPQKRGE